MLLFDQTFYPVIGSGREDDSSVENSRMVISAIREEVADEREHVEQNRRAFSSPPWKQGKKPVNNRKNSRSVLAPAGNSPLLPGCWDYSEVD